MLKKKSAQLNKENRSQGFAFAVMKFIAFDVQSSSYEKQQTEAIEIYCKLDQFSKNNINTYIIDILKNKQEKPLLFRMALKKLVTIISKSKDAKQFKELAAAIFEEEHTFQINLCKKIFEVIDKEVDLEKKEQFVVSGSLALCVELAILHHDINSTKASLSEEIINYVMSNLISRSNISNDSLRIALVTFFSNINESSSVRSQKVLERFGSSLFDNIFSLYLNEKDTEKSEIAYSFLEENLEEFLSCSPTLAETANGILQNKMMKNPLKFMSFLERYISFLKKKNNLLEKFIAHMSFLIKSALEINNERIYYSLIDLLFEYLFHYKNTVSKDFFAKQFETISDIFSKSKSVKAKEISRTVYERMVTDSKPASQQLLSKKIGINKKLLVFEDTSKKSKITGISSNCAADKIVLLCS